MNKIRTGRLGATPTKEGSCHFCVWAPGQSRVDVCLAGNERIHRLDADGLGYHRGTLEDVLSGSRYLFRLSGKVDRPDPASRLQPKGVHGASEVVDLAFEWTDAAWSGLPLSSYVLYELHVGTFTRDGTFDAVIGELDRLRELGITAIEIMPVAQFPGTRNWGYDGVYPFAVQDSYGGPRALQRLVDACHARGLAVVLDVVYNHLGPEGNYLADYGPYFTDVYHTPWGKAINFDGPDSDGVRRFFIENALQWIRDFHIDGLRLDAVHAILDRSAHPFLEELADEVHRLGRDLRRQVILMGESDANDPRLISESARGGFGLDAMWCDDFHHAVHVLLTGEQSGYYMDFGQVEDLARAWNRGMTYRGDYSRFRKRRHGRPIAHLKPEQIVVCVQNHDQVGNRLHGERLGALVNFEAEKLATGVLLLSPFTPLLFMGQEYGETAPFQYFVSHSSADLVKAVQNGRKEEFQSFGWKGDIPDPQSEDIFRNCTLKHGLSKHGRHQVLYELHRKLLSLRRRFPPCGADVAASLEDQRVLFVRRDSRAWIVFCFSGEKTVVTLPLPDGTWKKVFDSADFMNGVVTNCGETPESGEGGQVTLMPWSFSVYEAVAPFSQPSDVRGNARH